MIRQDKIHPELRVFANDYFKPTWIEGPRGTRAMYEIAAWNCFDSTVENTDRTNNAAEGRILALDF